MQTATARTAQDSTDGGGPQLVAAPAATQSARGKRPFLILGALVVIVVGTLAARAIATANQENTDDAQIEGDVVALAPRVGGFVKHVAVSENQQVNKGDIVFQVDDVDLRARAAQARAELAVAMAQERAASAQEQIVSAGARGGFDSAKALVSSSQLNVHSADSQVQVARAALDRARADARKADLDLSRTKQLYAGNSVTEAALDADRLNAESAAAALTQAEARLESAENERRAASSRVAQAQGTLAASTPIDAQIAAARAQTELARARVQSAQATVELAEMQLSYATVRAPEAGLVAKLSVHAGGLVSPNQPVAELVPRHTYVIANFKETQVGRLRRGDTAKIAIDAYPRRTFLGKVESLSGGTGARFSLLPPDNASGNFVKVVQRVPVRIAWQAEPDVPLRVGLSVDVTVDVSGL